MKINVDIMTDPEIRKQVREIIKGEVVSLTREYFYEVIDETVKEYLFRMTQKSKGWEDKYHNPFIYAVEKAIQHHIKMGWNGKMEVQEYVNKFFSEHFKNWMPKIDMVKLEKDITTKIKSKIMNSMD